MPSKSPYANSNPPRVDVVLFTLKDEKLQVALFKRERELEPYYGCYALPGGLVHEDEDDMLIDAAARVLLQKTGLKGIFLEELCSFSGKYRDPRGWSMTIAHLAVVHHEKLTTTSAQHGCDLKLFPVDELGILPFDHASIIQTAVERMQSKSSYSTLPIFLCGPTFSLPEVEKAYEKASGVVLKSAENFQRKLKEMDVIEKVDSLKAQSGGGRRAQLYKLKSETPALFSRARGLIS